MFSQALNRVELGVDWASAFLRANNSARSLVVNHQLGLEPSALEMSVADVAVAAPQATQWRVLDHCAAVGQIYALFEQFCEGILSDWITFRSQDCKFAELPQQFRISYATGFAIILGELGKVRYHHLSGPDLIAEYHAALNGEATYALAPECLTYHRNNIRWTEVTELFQRVGIMDLDTWTGRHPAMLSHFETERKILELVQSKLAGLVGYRNDAAHGLVAVDEILGMEELLNHAEFVRALCNALSERMLKEGLAYLESIGKASVVGVVTEVFGSHISVCNMEGTTVRSNDTFYLVSPTNAVVRTVESLMLDDKPVPEAVIVNPTELGIKFDEPVRKRAKLYRV